MGFVGIVIVVLVFLFFKSLAKNKVKEKKTSNMSDEFFEKKVIEVLDHFVIYYKTKPEYSNQYNFIYGKSFIFKSEIQFEKFSRIMKNKIQNHLEENNLMLRLETENKVFDNEDGSISYFTQFCKRKYTLMISFTRTKKPKFYDVIIGVLETPF